MKRAARLPVFICATDLLFSRAVWRASPSEITQRTAFPDIVKNFQHGIMFTIMNKTTPPLLTLNLKGIYFDAIANGSKLFEYRLKNPYWTKRLVGKIFSAVVIKRGYPTNSDTSRILTRPWCGYELQTICHPHFGPDPVEVFAIRVNDETT